MLLMCKTPRTRMRLIKLAKPIKNKNKLDQIRKMDLMPLFNRINKDKIEKVHSYNTCLTCLSCLLKIEQISSDEGALLFNKLFAWFLSNMSSVIAIGTECNEVLVLLCDKLDIIVKKFDIDLKHEFYMFDVIDDILKALENIDIMDKVIEMMVRKTHI